MLYLARMLPVTVAAAPLQKLLIAQSVFENGVKSTHDFAVFEENQRPNNIRKPDTRTGEPKIRVSAIYLPAVVYFPSKMTYVPYRIYGRLFTLTAGQRRHPSNTISRES
jgi:hypothetical protein